MPRKPKIVAHRGGAGLRPENTLAACAHALAMGADGLEIDIRLSRDKEVVVFHDAVLDPDHARPPGGAGVSGQPPLVRDLSLRQLKTFDVGQGRALPPESMIPAAPGERIPTLREVLDFVNGLPRAPLLLIELKTDFHTATPLNPYELTEAALAILGSDMTDGFIRLMSFDWRCLVHAMSIVPSDRCVFLTVPEGKIPPPDDAPWFAGHAPRRYGGSVVEAIAALGGRHWGPHYAQLSPEAMADARGAGMAVSTWTVNEPRQIKRVQVLGVDHLITDYPDRALAIRSK